MKTTLIVTLSIVVLIQSIVTARQSYPDTIIKTGTANGKKRHLSPAERAKFIAENKNYRSDLFKPTVALASDTSLLRDSTYVKAFRSAAYEKAYKRRTAGHYILVGGIIITGIIIIAAIKMASNIFGNTVSTAFKNGYE